MSSSTSGFGIKIKIALILTIVLVLLVMGLRFLRDLGNNEGYAPEQPIPFSHKLHAGQYQIPCMYCHVGVEKSRHATVPSMNICMNCHSVVAYGSPHIQKLRKLYLEQKEPFQWVRVHDLPDYVFFNHKRHVAKGVQCETCHGDVKKMDRIHQEHSLGMGWCLDCHRGDSTPSYLYEKEKHMGEPVAPTSCNTCHH